MTTSGPPAWSVRRGHASVFLFGVRPGARDDGWVDDRVTAAMTASDEFWRETPPEEELISSPLILELGLSPDVPLSERLDEATRTRLDAVTESLEIDRRTIEPLRPWIVAQLVQQRSLVCADIPPEQDMDIVLAQLATEHAATVRYEFSVEELIRTFGGMDTSMELDYLRFVLDAAEGGRELIDIGFSAWLHGDRRLDELGDADWRERYPRLYVPLIRDRNVGWIPRIDEMLSRPGTRFVAVGCGHLAGPESIPRLLEQLECEVTTCD